MPTTPWDALKQAIIADLEAAMGSAVIPGTNLDNFAEGMAKAMYMAGLRQKIDCGTSSLVYDGTIDAGSSVYLSDGIPADCGGSL